MATSQLQSEGMLTREQLLHLFNRFSLLISQPDVRKRIADAVKDKQQAVVATIAIQEGIFMEMGVELQSPEDIEQIPPPLVLILRQSLLRVVANKYRRLLELIDLQHSCLDFYKDDLHKKHAIRYYAHLQLCYLQSVPEYLVVFKPRGWTDPRFGTSCLEKVNMVYGNDRDLMIQFYKFVAKEEMACDEAELRPDEFAEKLHKQQMLHEQQLEMLKQIRQFHLDDQSAILEKLHLQMENANFEGESSVLSLDQIQDIVGRRVSPIFTPR